ncbi:hypothetical protein DBV05_g11897 [Lasiodiplodia theobromae]|uniref:BTB domain-containing protein n=1 Tax=Lasiodiplodia theobromae TaxID=45133 RepID=A0A5N5CVQ2_9PEZI|nr:hypothetical protein DBV05_g11897 [Lasiodiplodia theobromae]
MDSTKPSEENFPTFANSLKKLLANGKFSDMKIKCGDTVHNVHRAIMCTQSSFFANALKEEHNFKESQTSTIELHDDPDIVQAAIDFMYHEDYFASIDHNYMYGIEKVNFHLQMYIFADKYGIGDLREKSTMVIELIFANDWMFNPEGFLHAVSTVWEYLPENDEVLRPTLVRIAAQTLRELWNRDAFEETVQNASGFGAAVLQKLVKLGAIDQKNRHGVHSYFCTKCWGNFLMKLNDDRSTFCPGCGHCIENVEWESERGS